MILRLSDSLSRGLLVAAALLIGAWLSFFSVRAALARYESERVTAAGLKRATELEKGNPEYWYGLGRYQQYNLEQPDSEAAERSYNRATGLNPVYTDALLDLATAYELDGNTGEATKAYLRAKRTYPVSAEVAWRYGNFLLRQGEQNEAYAELKQAIQSDPSRGAAAFSRAYRTNPDLNELFEKLMPADKAAYIGVIWDALGERHLAVAKFAWMRLMRLNPRPQLDWRDVDYFAAQFLSAGEFAEAREVWDQGAATMKLPPLLQPKGTVVWDPSFEAHSDANNKAFSWRYSPNEGVTVTLDNGEKLSGQQSLRISFDGRHDPELDLACTLGLVQPSTTYQFSAWIKTKNLTSDQGVGFRVRGIGDDDPRTILRTTKTLGTTSWMPIEGTWSSGANVRRVQVCAYRDASGNEERIQGYAWIDDVNLLPEPEHHKQ